MTKGAIYFTCGASHCERLLVSVYSLRKVHPSFPVTVVMLDDGKAPKGFIEHLDQLNVQVVKFSPVSGYSALCHKIRSLRFAPYDLNFFIDADTVVVDSIEEAFTPFVNEKVDFAFVNFAGWKSCGSSISKRIRRFAKALPESDIEKAVSFGPALNVGTFVFRKNADFIVPWETGTVLGAKNRVFIPDEIYAQVALPDLVASGKAVVLGREWGESVRYGTTKGAKILHYHGDKHDGPYPMCDIWRKLRDESTARQFQYSDNTLVVAADSKYFGTLLTSLKSWREGAVLRGVRTMLIHDGSLTAAQVAEVGFEKEVVYQNQLAKTQRELMLNSFVLCAPFEVETPFWTKLDADCQVDQKTRLFESPKWRAFDLVSHRWGYTKPASWVPALEEWRKKKDIGVQFIPDEQLVLEPGQRTFRSSRIQSFACFHNTLSSQRMAEPAMEDGILPVPSHDTYLWFMAEALGLKTEKVNLKKWGFRH